MWALSGTGADAVRRANLGGDEKPASDENTKSTLSFFGSLVPSYFQSEWSFAQFRTNVSHTLVAFGSEPNTIIIVGADGSFWKASYEGGGECVENAYCKFAESTKKDAESGGGGGGGGQAYSGLKDPTSWNTENYKM